jgi:hypothetical protein
VSDALSVAYWPRAHDVHEDLPSDAAIWPAPQIEQALDDVAMAVDDALPAGHKTHEQLA